MSQILLGIIIAFFLYLIWELKWPVNKRRTAIKNLLRFYPELSENQSVETIPTASQPEKEDVPDVPQNIPEPQNNIPLAYPEPVPARPQKPPWTSEINTFIAKYIEPYNNALEYNNCLPVIENLLDILNEYGGCPSVVEIKEDMEYKQFSDIASTYDALKQITLLDHSLNVAQKLVELAQDKKDYQISIGKWLIIGLGHDIGKIPKFRTGAYTKGDHPILSRSLLDDILPDDLPAREDILNAVRDHHFPNASSDSTVMLRKADFNARSMELKSVNPSAETGLHKIEQKREHETGETKNDRQDNNKPKTVDLSWMERERFIERLENKINVIEHGIFRAFSMKDGLVYFWLETLSDVVIELAKEENRLDVMSENRRNIEYSVRVMFAEFVPDFIGETYPGARFQMKDENGKPLNYALLLPLRAEIFSCSPAELEQRKKARLLKIHEVEPLVRKKNT